MIRVSLIYLACFLCLSFDAQKLKPKVVIEDGKVLVDGKFYCLIEYPEKGSRSFKIIAPKLEDLVITADVKVKGALENGQVQNYFNIKLIPSYKELNIKYYKDFPDRFIETLVSYDVIPSGIWSEYGASQLYEHWMMSDDAITDVASNQFVYSKSLALKLAGYEINCKKDNKQVSINDSLVYTYWVWDNWTRGYKYRKGIEELYYHIYDLDSNLQAVVAVRDHRSDLSTNVKMKLLPEQELYYFADIPKGNEQTIINAATRMLISKKWNK